MMMSEKPEEFCKLIERIMRGTGSLSWPQEE
jgi:hypothetical protein